MPFILVPGDGTRRKSKHGECFRRFKVMSKNSCDCRSVNCSVTCLSGLTNSCLLRRFYIDQRALVSNLVTSGFVSCSGVL